MSELLMKATLHNQTVLITGASRGLGAKIAELAWQAGANLILIARSFTKLQQLRDKLLTTQSPNRFIKIFQIDLAVEAEVVKCIDALKVCQDIDVLVNNAAMHGPIGKVWENDWQDWQTTLQVNLLAPIALCRACIPTMIKNQHGKIINLSGGGATGPRPNFSAYAVAKVGLVRFSEILAHEVAQYNIDVNCIAPGVMNSELLAQIVKVGVEQAGKKEYKIAQENAQGGEEVVERAAKSCLYLASSISNGITGKLISAVWDPWQDLHNYIDELKDSDIYTLRRIIPKERGKSWGDVS
jgi:3-oxoacyl-[acyl-carrier protein] reductase